MTHGLDCILIHPNGRSDSYQGLHAANLTAIEPPIWCLLLASYLRKRGRSVEILDAVADNLTPAQVADIVADKRPRLVAVVVMGQNPNSSSQTLPAAGAVVQAVKSRASFSLVGMVGGHVAELPERTLTEERPTFVISGEGPETLNDLVDFAQYPDPRFEPPGLWWKGGNDVTYHTEPAPLVQNLDEEMPGGCYDLLPMERYTCHNWHGWGQLSRKPYAAIYTTLGCSFGCEFCCINSVFQDGAKLAGLKGNSYRMWRPQHVGSTIERLYHQYGVRNLKIADEMFVLNKSHVIGVCDEILQRKLTGLNIWAYARVDTAKDERMLDKLASAGFRWLALGIESASSDVRNGVDKGYKQDLIYSTVERIRSRGISIGANYIFGLPDDDLSSMEATFDLACELNTEYANFYPMSIFPGSPLWDQAVANGTYLPSDWSQYAPLAKNFHPHPTKHLSGKQVLQFRDDAFVRYFERPAYTDMIDRRFGPDAVKQVREMTAVKIERGTP